MLDTSGSMTGTISLLKAAAEQFLIRLLPDDKASVGAFNDKIELNAGFTNNRDKLVSQVKDLDYGNGTRLFDAISESLDALKGIEGRRVILVFTDGDDTSSHIGRGTVLDRARADEVMIYAIGLQSEYFDGARMVRSKPDSGLKKLADETGGGYFELKKTADLGPTFSTRRAGAPQPVRARVRSQAAGWQSAQAGRENEAGGNDCAGAEKLRGDCGS